MATILVPSAPVPAGALAAYQAVDDSDPETPLSFDVDDLNVAVAVDAQAGEFDRLYGDRLLVAYGPVDLPAGDHVVVVSVESATLGVLVTVASRVTTTAARYGATVAGVEALASDLRITYKANPSAADVTRWLDELGERVAGRIGPIEELTPALADLYTSRAAGLVHLGAAAYAVDAAHPDRITKQGDERYGAVLWARFVDGLAELGADVDRDRESEGLDPLGGLARAGAWFPPPLFSRGLDL